MEFVDYGNFGYSKLSDLCVAVGFGEIPSLAHPYFIRNLVASSDSGKWNSDILDQCRKHLVGKIFVIIVEHEEDNLKQVVPCNIRLTESNISLCDWLIMQQLNDSTAHHCDNIIDDDDIIVRV